MNRIPHIVTLMAFCSALILTGCNKSNTQNGEGTSGDAHAFVIEARVLEPNKENYVLCEILEDKWELSIGDEVLVHYGSITRKTEIEGENEAADTLSKNDLVSLTFFSIDKSDIPYKIEVPGDINIIGSYNGE